ncbi:MAG: SIS domain-containing protein [Verrucomicrobiales bacterium]|jgi:D-sedoheptulose 7-phosphate isomerase|nr:SIS domain-containing protein [Verrucomicrobiales bacterium]
MDTKSLELVASYLDHLSALLGRIDAAQCVAIGRELHRTCREGGTVYVCGNGGSASTASHLACDVSKNVTTTDRHRLRVISLTDNMAHFSAIANDLDYSEVFAEQMRNILTPRDAVIAISASGNSPNVVKAAEFARNLGCPVIAFTGFSGGRLRELASSSLHVESREYGPVEDLHLVFNHLLVIILRELVASEAAEAN